MDESLQADLELACEFTGIWSHGRRCPGNDLPSNWFSRCEVCGIEADDRERLPPNHELSCPPLDDALAMRMLRALREKAQGVLVRLITAEREPVFDVVITMNGRMFGNTGIDLPELIVSVIAAVARHEASR